MIALFSRHAEDVFSNLRSVKAFQDKAPVIRDIQDAYTRQRWAACVCTTVPLLDALMRCIFRTESLKASIQVFRDALAMAQIAPKDLMPGYVVWDGIRNPTEGNAFTKSVEEDLRLPGVLLSSFAEFANRYYEWYTSTTLSPSTPLNRHGVMHCATHYWSEESAVRILTFLDLTLRLSLVLQILAGDETAGKTSSRTSDLSL